MFPKLDRIWQIPAVYFILLTALALATPLTFAPYYQFWLMPLLFGGLVRLIELKPHRAVRSAYWFGFIGYTAQFWWIHTALHGIAKLPEYFALPLTLLLPAFLGLYPALAFWLYRYFRLPRSIGLGIGLPVLWTLTEFARERLLTGFGWGALGYSQIADNSPLAGFAPIGGIHLVTFATALVGTWLVLLVNSRVAKPRIAAAIGIASLLLSGCLLRTIAFTQPTGRPTTVALAQGNIEQQLKFAQNQLLPTYQRYLGQVASTRAQIVILPETALPVFLQNTPSDILQDFAQTARRNGSSLAVGVPMFTPDSENYLNAIVNLTDYTAQTQPETLPIYAKNHLVPFGEYKPLKPFTQFLYNAMNMPLGDFQQGGAAQAPFSMANQKVAFNICYEDGFGDELIASARQATLLANASNMAWYGDSNAMWQQLQQSQTRALELGRYMIRATNTGATAIVSPQGSIVKQATPNTATVLEGSVQGMAGETPFMRLGGSLPLIGLLAAIAGWLKWRFRQPENEQSEFEHS